jgi:hypothetical protein
MVLENSHLHEPLRENYCRKDVDAFCSNRRAGALLTFTTFLVHASLDNHSDRIRLSSDSRYQPASEPADERWIGPNPIAHGPQAKRGMVC